MKKQLILLLFLTPLSIFAQNTVQTIKGTVSDRDTKQPLIGATVKVTDLGTTVGSVADENGNFRIENVPVGRHKIECTFVGYDTYVSDNIILNSAKELALNIELVESATTTAEVVIKAKKTGSEPVNEASILSSRSFTMEETQRYASSANDPSRMAMGFPGVQANRDNRSDIIVRGNSSFGLLWRLEGIDIPNPNHFARKGSSGGGITIFSTAMLGASDFSSSAFPAEYGNAFSGVFDMKLRKGNNEKREYFAKIGLLGLDFGTEGPVGKNGGSYLVNYRYSTLGLLNKAGLYLVGERVENTFQDLSFHVSLPSKNKKHIFGIWGIGGLSSEQERASDSLKTIAESIKSDFRSNMGSIALNHTYLIDSKSFIKTTVALMKQRIIFDDTLMSAAAIPPTPLSIEHYDEGRLTLSSYYSRKINAKLSLKTGVSASQLFYDFLHTKNARLTQSFNIWTSTNNATKMSALVQPYASLRYRANDKLSINGGIHVLYFSLNNTASIEPRLGFKYQIKDNQYFSVAYGLHGRTLPLGVYYNYNANTSTYPNINLKMMKTHQTVAAYDHIFGEKTTWRFHIEAYYQLLRNVPVSPDLNSTYSFINEIQGFGDRAMVSKGKGRNFGTDIMLEKIFSKGAFMILSGSFYRSLYTDINGKEHATQYNARFSSSLMAGKEWKVSPKGVLQVGTKIIYNGGLPLTPLAATQTAGQFYAILDESRPYTDDTPQYFRPDVRIAYRHDGKKTAYTVAIDVQNVANRRNQDGLSRDYDPTTNAWVYRKQSALVPILSFQIDF